jgi:hypothetical protein
MSEEGALTCLRVRSFENLLRETMDDVLKQVFGEEPAKIIVQHVERESGSLKCEKNAKKVEDALQEILGSGSVTVESLILKSLYSKLESKFEEKEDYGFSDHLLELRKKCR